MIRSVFQLLSGNVAAQAIFIAFAIWLPRLYGPAAFGDLALFMAAVNIFTPLAAGRYEMTLVLPESDEQARSLLQLSGWIIAGSFLVFLLLSPIFVYFSASWSWGVLAITLAACLLSAFLYLGQQYLVRFGAFATLSVSKVLLAGAASLVQLLAFYTLQNHGLIVGYTVGLLVSLTYVASFRPSSMTKLGSRSDVRRVAREYFHIVKYSWPGSALNVLAANIQPFILAALFGLKEAGFFFLAYRLLGLPLNALSSAVSGVFYRDVVAHLRQGTGQAYRLSVRIVMMMGGITLAGFLIFFFTGEVLFDWVFGETWRPAYTYALLLMPLFLGKSLVNPISVLAEALGKTRAVLLFSAGTFMELLVAALFGKIDGRVEVFLYIYSIGAAVAYLLLAIFLIRHTYKADLVRT